MPLSMLVVPSPLTEAGLEHILLHFFHNNTAVVTSILKQYPLQDFTDNYDRLSTLLRDGKSGDPFDHWRDTLIWP